MGLESINKASAATQSVQTTAPVTTNVQAAGSSAQTADYTAAQAVQLSFGQDSTSPESQESKATLADVKDISSSFSAFCLVTSMTSSAVIPFSSAIVCAT